MDATAYVTLCSSNFTSARDCFTVHGAISVLSLDVLLFLLLLLLLVSFGAFCVD